MIRRFFTGRDGTAAAGRAAGAGPRRGRRGRPALEGLEGRSLLSYAGSLHRVSALYGDNYASANASSSGGTSVVVWVNSPDKYNPHIYAQRFDVEGNPTGPVIAVDDSIDNTYTPAVAMDASGRFVVAWEDDNPSTSVGTIQMRAYSAAGVPLNAVTRVSTGTTVFDYAPSVAASNGSFVIAYQHFNGTSYDVRARRYVYTSGVPASQSAFVVDQTGQENGTPSVAMAPDGRFDIAYEHFPSSVDSNAYLARYSAAGTRSGTSPVNVDANNEYDPKVSMDNAGNAVVAYTESFSDGTYGVFANRVSAAGAVAPLIRVAYAGIANVNYSNPSVALAPVGGDFVAAYGDVFGKGIDVEGIGADNTLLTYYELAGQDGIANESGAAVSIDGYGRFLVTNTASTAEIYSHRALLPTYPAQQVSSTANANLQTRNASSANGTSVVVWVNTRSTTDHDIYARRLDARGNPVGPAIAVDTTTADSYAPVVAMDASGRFVVAWEDLVDSIGGDVIEMRAFSAAGVPLDGITRVSSGTTGVDFEPSVAASNGSFVVAYEHSQAGYDIRARRYTYSSGVPVAQGTFVVAGTAQDESWPSVAMAPDGRFDVAYEYAYSANDHDIYLARYSAAGAYSGTSYVNVDTNRESAPSVSMDNAGNAVVAYTEVIGGSSGVFANRVSAAGAVGPRVTVAYGGGVSYWSPSVALSPTTGAFVVALDTSSFYFEGAFVMGVLAVEFSANDTALEPLVDALGSPNDGGQVSVSIDGRNRYLVTFADSNGSIDEVDSLRDFLST